MKVKPLSHPLIAIMVIALAGLLPLNGQEITSHDFFVDQITLTNNAERAYGTTLGASSTGLEPSSGGSGRTIWWSWVPATNGIAAIDTFGSAIDSVLAVFLGRSETALKWVAGNDDSQEFLSRQSLVRFPVVAGQPYRIRVDDKLGAGDVVLNIAVDSSSSNEQLRWATGASVTNDSFRNAIRIQGRKVSAVGYNLSVVSNGGNPILGIQNALWWQWRSESDDEVVVSTSGSTFDTALGVYRGTELQALTPVATNFDANNDDKTSLVRFRPQVGEDYRIMVTSQTANEAGSVVLSIQQHVLLKVGNAEIHPAFELELNSAAGTQYQLERSTDMIQWVPEGAAFIGNGSIMKFLISSRGQRQEYFQFVSP